MGGVHCKKRLAVFPSPAGMSLAKLSPAGNNSIIPGPGEFGLGMGKPLTFFYSVRWRDSARDRGGRKGTGVQFKILAHVVCGFSASEFLARGRL
jgi:hypothetical protein